MVRRKRFDKMSKWIFCKKTEKMLKLNFNLDFAIEILARRLKWFPGFKPFW